MVYKCFDKKSSGGTVKSTIMPDQHSAKELDKPIAANFEKRKLYFSFKGNIWCNDLVDMKIISKCDKVNHIYVSF